MPEKKREKQRVRRQTRLRAMDLTELGRHFGTDKATTHHYTQHYQRHFAHLREHEFNLLEIGIGGARREGKGGASLRMWSWFFEKAQIVGLDIEDKSFVAKKRIHIYRGDQTDPVVLNKLHAERGPFQVIIDDGSHRPDHVRATFEVLFPLLAPDGIYAIEDTQTSYWPEAGGSEDLHDRSTSMNLVKDLLDGLNYEEYVDEDYQPTYTDQHVVGVYAYHNLVFIQKGRNVEGTRRRQILHRRYGPS
ncbi:hypothetical protein GCM10027020_25660 [Nocardioides salsibiostraticola]